MLKKFLCFGTVIIMAISLWACDACAFGPFVSDKYPKAFGVYEYAAYNFNIN